LNAANEVSVDAFLNRRIRFDQIHAVNRATLDRVVCAPPVTLDDLFALDALSRAEAALCISQF
jgi:1-deoxy-D-xylulose-5-phosphate reductoisomerase